MPTMKHARTCAADAALRFLAPSDRALTRRPQTTPGLSKKVCRKAFRDVATYLGLHRGLIHLLDTLIGNTKPHDWDDGWPISHISNRRLCRETGFKEAHVSAMIRKLHDLGIVNRRYAANGHRWVQRNEKDLIVAASGIDLSPIIALVPTWKHLFAREEEKRLAHEARCKAIIDRRKAICVALDAASGLGDERLDSIRKDLDEYVVPNARDARSLRRKGDEHLLRVEETLEELQAELHRLFEDVVASHDGTTVVTFEQDHIRTQSYPKSSSSTDCAEAQTSVQSPSAASGKKKGGGRGVPLPVARLPKAFPTLWARMSNDPAEWERELPHVAASVLHELGLREAVWHEWRAKLGPMIASLAVAITYERATTMGRHRMDDPSSAGGYFVGCARAAEAGEFMIAASIHGFADENERAERKALRDDAI